MPMKARRRWLAMLNRPDDAAANIGRALMRTKLWACCGRFRGSGEVGGSTEQDCPASGGREADAPVARPIWIKTQHHPRICPQPRGLSTGHDANFESRHSIELATPKSARGSSDRATSSSKTLFLSVGRDYADLGGAEKRICDGNGVTVTVETLNTEPELRSELGWRTGECRCCPFPGAPPQVRRLRPR